MKKLRFIIAGILVCSLGHSQETPKKPDAPKKGSSTVSKPSPPGGTRMAISQKGVPMDETKKNTSNQKTTGTSSISTTGKK
jgi:hypothetical protein